MRTPTLFAVAIASLLINFSQAARSNLLSKRIAPAGGVFEGVTSGDVGSIVDTASSLVASKQGENLNKSGGLLKRDLLGGDLPVVGSLLGGGESDKKVVQQAANGKGHGRKANGGRGQGRKANGGRGQGRRPTQKNNRKAQPASEKKGGLLGGGLPLGLLKRDLLGGGLPVVGSLLGGGESDKKVVQQAANGKGHGRKANGGRGQGRKANGGRGQGRGPTQKNNRKAQPASDKKGGLLGGLPAVGGILG